MKIERGSGVASTSGSKRAGAATAAPGFSVSVEAPQRAPAMGGVASVAALDVIIALQADEPAAQRRARQARRGQDALDALEELERGLLLGRAPASLHGELDRLRCASELTGEEGLDAVLREIDIRLAVEAAKLERLRGGP